MEKYQKILQHKKFLSYIKKIKKWEKDRIFCCHDASHLLDVARIAYIRALERKSSLSKDVIYGAALLHDIGKIKQYKEKIPHEITGSVKAGKILADCGYDEEEIRQIQEAILHHRRGSDPMERELSLLLYEADKTSRTCMLCSAYDSCNWTEEEKNKVLTV